MLEQSLHSHFELWQHFKYVFLSLTLGQIELTVVQNASLGFEIIYIYILYIYRVSQEECARLREGVPYVKVYRYNPKHLYPKLNCYGDSGRRKWGLLAFPNTATCTADVSRESVDDLESGMHGSWKRHVKCLEP